MQNGKREDTNLMQNGKREVPNMMQNGKRVNMMQIGDSRKRINISMTKILFIFQLLGVAKLIVSNFGAPLSEERGDTSMIQNGKQEDTNMMQNRK